MSAQATIAAWVLCNKNEDCFTAGEAIVEELRKHGYAVVPIKPTDEMLEELARIGDGPAISGEEVWGYMLAAGDAATAFQHSR